MNDLFVRDGRVAVLTLLLCTVVLTGCVTMPLAGQAIMDMNAGRCDKGIAELKQGLTSGDANASNSVNSRDSFEVLLGDAYSTGDCVPQSEATARSYYIAAAKLGNQAAISRLFCLDPAHAAQCEAQLAADQAQVQAMIAASPPAPTLTFDHVHQMQAGILNSTQRRTPASPSPVYTPPAPPAYSGSAQTFTAGNGFVYDNALDRCVKLGNDGQSVYFQNSCNASLTIAFYQAAGIGTGATDCGSGARCTFGAFGIGYSANNNTTYAVCPQGDSAVLPDGNQWQGQGAFRCRRP